ncbi:MAG: hypothetical protein J0L67_11000 [Cytophagales bacterium]|nr:hypothetical protein [Cytophagales bacterium]
MSTNIFSGKRFQLLVKQHFIHNAQFLLLSSGAYVGVIFIVLSVVQVGNGLEPHRLEIFQGFLIGFVTVFGILYVGHSFPAFRSKESAISYLMLPASALEKFLFEFVSRIGIILLTLPLLFWITYHLQGYFFALFTDQIFKSVGLQYLIKIDDDVPGLVYWLTSGGVLFALSLAFTGAAMFTKQPLVKSLFAVAMIVMFFGGYSYIIIEHVGVGRYNPPDTLLLIPTEEETALRFFTLAFFAASAVMLFVAYCKLKEREV